MVLRRGSPFVICRLLLALGSAVLPWIATPLVAQTKPPNVLLILVDDVGPEHLDRYGIGQDAQFAETPELDEWIDTWLQFEQAWATPLCSPTRVAIQTGRFGFHTGVGTLVPDDTVWGLDPTTEPNTLAKLLGNQIDDFRVPVAYTTAAFGKWHMGSSEGESGEVPDQGGAQSPAETGGYDSFVVTQHDLQQGTDPYFHYWVSIPERDSREIDVAVDGIDQYLTHATFQWFIDWCEDNDCKDQRAPTTPWFVYLAPFAAHAPLHCPPAELYPQVNCSPGDNGKTKYYAMIHSLSIEIDRTLSYLAAVDPTAPVADPENTLIIVAGDNGSPVQLSEKPFDQARSKGTVYEGGVRVPLWIGGDVARESGVAEVARGHFVQVMDLFPTILEVAGLCEPGSGCPPALELDGVSLADFIDRHNPKPVKDFAYVEWFYPNFDPDPTRPEGPATASWAVRSATHKLVRSRTGETALYRVSEDPFERTNLFRRPNLSPADRSALEEIVNFYRSLGFGELGQLGLCALEPVGGPCGADDECCSGLCMGDTCQLPPELR